MHLATSLKLTWTYQSPLDPIGVISGEGLP